MRFDLWYLCLLLAGVTEAAPIPAIIPRPLRLACNPGVFELHAGAAGESPTRILVDAAATATGRYLAEQLRQLGGCSFPVVPGNEGPAAQDCILLTTQGRLTVSGPEAYELTVSPHGVVIRAHDTAGLFFGIQSLCQLLALGPDPAGTSLTTHLALPCVHIEDQPRFKWRGVMLDVSRHFFSKTEVEQLLDAMARYKLNTFHWHLTDDQGWRIEIKKYPRLTQVGAWRNSIGFGLDPKAGTAYGRDGRYGGYYTQKEIRDVVAYASERHITIVPEIEMPGHASAALMAYPQFSCTGGPFTTDLPGGVFDGVYCAGNDATFAFLQDVLSEVFTLFPGKYIHVGGDEVLTNNWSRCFKCQARRKQEGLQRDIELESYFIRRIEKFVNSRGRVLIGWSEIREGGLAPSAVVMDWAGGAVEAASAGHDVVMSPLADCYFDHYQSEDHSTEPHAIGGFLPLQQVYEFEPLPPALNPQFENHILGAQANVWTEYMPSLQHVEYMVFPRLCALAEVTWSAKSLRDWQDFEQRLDSHYRLLDGWRVNYRHPTGLARQTSRTQ